MDKITSKNRNSEKRKPNKKAAAPQASADTVEVLYQRLGDRWFAFSVVDDEVFFTEVPEDAIAAVDANMNKSREPKAA